MNICYISNIIYNRKCARTFSIILWEEYARLIDKGNNGLTKQSSTETQTHVHEFAESTKLAENGEDRHNHRVAGVTSEVIPIGNGQHVHAILSNTDFLDHHHEIGVTTGPNIQITGTNKHVHVVKGSTTIDDGHNHDFLFTTQIDSPLV